MKELLMTVGLPRSGKSTWAKSTGLPMVNPDSIRLALHGQRFIGEAEPMVWAIAKYMVKALFEAGHDKVILDATNTTKERRAEWISKSWRRKFIVIPTSKEECINRSSVLDDAYILPIIEKMALQFQPVYENEELMGWEATND